MLDTKARSAASMTPYRALIEVRSSGQTGFCCGSGCCGKVTRRETASASLAKTLSFQGAQSGRFVSAAALRAAEWLSSAPSIIDYSAKPGKFPLALSSPVH